VDEQGRVYVTNMVGGVDVFTSEGQHITRLGVAQGEEGVGVARGLALGQKGQIYVVDVTGQQVQVYDTRSDDFPVLYSFGSFGLEGGEFRFPASVAVDSSGRIYVADRENYRVQIWS
jgi:DNA-binding beta-propeller fold protein YncE